MNSIKAFLLIFLLGVANICAQPIGVYAWHTNGLLATPTNFWTGNASNISSLITNGLATTNFVHTIAGETTNHIEAATNSPSIARTNSDTITFYGDLVVTSTNYGDGSGLSNVTIGVIANLDGFGTNTTLRPKLTDGTGMALTVDSNLWVKGFQTNSADALWFQSAEGIRRPSNNRIYLYADNDPGIGFAASGGGGAVYQQLWFGGGRSGGIITSEDTVLWRDASGILAQRNSTSPQTNRIYGTYADASNFERLEMGYDSTKAAYRITADYNGSGTAKPIYIGAGGYTNIIVNTSGQLLTTDGAVATPALGPQSDSDTGFYFPQVAQVWIARGGAATMRFYSEGIQLLNDDGIHWSSSIGVAYQTSLNNDNPGVSAWRLSTNPQTNRIYGTYTDASNFERLESGYDSTKAAYRITAGYGGTGSARPIYIGAGGYTNVVLTTSGTILANATVNAYSFQGDEDTGIYSSSANRIAFRCGGADELKLIGGGGIYTYDPLKFEDTGKGYTLGDFGVKTNNPQAALHVVGGILSDGSFTNVDDVILGSSSSGGKKLLFGKSAGSSATSATFPIFMGDYSGRFAVNSDNGVYIGYATGDRGTNADNSVFIGKQAGQVSQNAYNSVFIGYVAGNYGTTANDAVFLGYQAGQYATNGAAAIILGSQAGNHSTTGNGMILIGQRAGQYATNSHSSAIVGRYAGEFGSSNAYSVFVGPNVGQYASNAAYNVILGQSAGRYASELTYCVGLGNTAAEAATNATHSVMLGNRAGQYGYNAEFATLLGSRAGWYGHNATNTVAVGPYAFAYGTNSYKAVAIGDNAGIYAPAAAYSVMIGPDAGMSASNNSAGSIFIGREAGKYVQRDNTLVIDSVVTGNRSASGTNAFIYGEMDNSRLVINATAQATAVLHANNPTFTPEEDSAYGAATWCSNGYLYATCWISGTSTNTTLLASPTP